MILDDLWGLEDGRKGFLVAFGGIIRIFELAYEKWKEIFMFTSIRCRIVTGVLINKNFIT